jgi:hypothetical protein
MSATPNLISLQTAAAAIGNGTQINTMDGYGLLSLDVSGTFVGTVSFEGTIDGTNWYAVGLKPWTDAVAVTSATAIGQFKAPTDILLSKFRARVSAWTSGTITVKAFVLSRNI